MSSPILQIKDSDAFARRLRQARRKAGLTLKELSFEGCSVVYLSRIENCQRRPSVWIAWGLANRLGVSPHWLISGREDPLILAARKVVAEYRAGVTPPQALIDKLDRLSR